MLDARRVEGEVGERWKSKFEGGVKVVVVVFVEVGVKVVVVVFVVMVVVVFVGVVVKVFVIGPSWSSVSWSSLLWSLTWL